MNKKICSKCKTEKDCTEFNRRENNRLSSWCKSCVKIKTSEWEKKNKSKKKIYMVKWNNSNKDVKRNAELKCKYGITLEQYNKMLKSQQYRCAICGNTGNGKALHLDHNHITGQVRGLICYNCNTGLGQFKTDEHNDKLLMLATQYIRRIGKPTA